MIDLTFQLSSKDPIFNDWNERKLIESRLQSPLVSSDSLCAYHRYSLGIGWKQPKRCCHPEHQGTKGIKAPSLRVVPLKYLPMFAKNGTLLPAGGKFCVNHYKLTLKCYAEAENNKENNSAEELTPVKCSSPNDDIFIPDIAVVSEESINKSENAANSLCETLDASPFTFTIKEKLISDLSDGTKQKVRQKYERAKLRLEKRFAEAIAPGQSEELIAQVLRCEDQIKEQNVPSDLEVPLKMFNESDPVGQVMILAIVDHSKYTKETLMNIFGCKRHIIDKARALQKRNEGLSIPQKDKISRSRMPKDKIEHFLEFLFSRNLLQDVAYGINKIKFDSGEEQKVANAILTMKFSHTIAFYKESCIEMNYAPMSDASLWRILHGINPSQRKALAGLDDVTAAGMNGFQMLLNIAEKWKCKDLVKSLEKGKRYLKSNYPVRCGEQSNLKSHCTTFALSDPSDADLCHAYDVCDNEECTDCMNLFLAIDEVRQLVEKNNDEDLTYDFNVAVADVEAYIKHQIRDAQQKLAKLDAFQKLDEKTGFWLKDFCQKILPAKYREGQKEYFGKKGMSLHVDVFFLKEGEQLRKKVYFTAAFRCEQGLVDSLCLADVVSTKIKEDFPSITQLYAKSDNAAAYHGNYVVEALYQICKSKGLELKRYDYNEPSRGKDQCDRESAGAKSVIRSYVDAGNDVTTAEDIFKALHYGKGIKNADVAVVSIDSKASTLSGSAKIPNIKNYHSFEFFSDHMIMWRYYGIGEGKKWKYSNVTYNLSIEVIKPYSSTSKDRTISQAAKKPRIDRKANNFMFCPEDGCLKAFPDEESLTEHILSGNHTDESSVAGKSMTDQAKLSYIARMKQSNQNSSNHEFPQNSSSNASVSSGIPRFTNIAGWALPKRKIFRYSAKQKTLLMEMFLQGIFIFLV